MDDIGNILKQARIDKNMTIRDVHEVTKIMPRYLEAIEEGQWDLLPGTAYAKGYIRSYAEVVEVDGDYLIELFNEILKTSNNMVKQEEQLYDKKRKSYTRLLKDVSESRSGTWGIVALVCIVVVIAIVHFSSNWAPPHDRQNPDSIEQPPVVQQPSESEPESKAESKVDPEVEVEPEPEPIPPETQLTLLEQKANSTIYTIDTDKELFTATISTINGPCWVRITADGKKIWEGTMQVDDTHTAQATNELTIRMGLPQNANIEVEEQKLPHIDSKNPHDFTIQR